MFITAYYTTWGACDLPPSKVDYDAVTHIVHQSIQPTADSRYAGRWWRFPNKRKEDDTLHFEQGLGTGCSAFPVQRNLIDMSHAKGVTVLLGLGADEDNYAAIASDNTKLREYVASVLSYAKSKGYDGVDIDWEFVRSAYRNAFINLINVMKNTLETWDPPGLLTVAVPGWYNPYNDVPTMNARVDQINLMTYDMTGWWSATTGFNAPIYAPQLTNYIGGNADRWVNGWLGAGLDPAKTGFGVPFYGLSWEGATEPVQSYTREYQVSYNWIMAKYNSSTYRWQSNAKVPYLSIPVASDGKKYFISYDDSLSLTLKVDYAKSKNLGGIMVFELWRGLLNGRQPLMDAVRKATWGTPPPPSPTLTAPILIQPHNGATEQNTTLLLGWSSVSGASTYHLQVSTVSDFSSTILNDTGVIGTLRQIGPLNQNTRHYWRVRAKSGLNVSPWSVVFGFTTVSPPTGIIVSPTSINFGRVRIGTTRSDSFLVINKGTSGANVTLISTSSVFRVSRERISIPAGSSAVVYVVFTPTAKTYYSGTINLRDSLSGRSAVVTLSGTGGRGPQARRNVASIHFGTIPAGDVRIDSFMVYNDGDLKLDVADMITTNASYTIHPRNVLIEPADSTRFYITAQADPHRPEGGRIASVDNSVEPLDSLPVTHITEVAMGSGETPGTPRNFQLEQNYPNPFNPSTTIRYYLPEMSTVVLSLFNVVGQEIARLIDGEEQMGHQTVALDFSDQPHGQLASGVYTYRLSAQGTQSGRAFTDVKKMILIR